MAGMALKRLVGFEVRTFYAVSWHSREPSTVIALARRRATLAKCDLRFVRVGRRLVNPSNVNSKDSWFMNVIAAW
jgi:hypothetical protein